MPPVPDAVQRWAAAHAASLRPSGPPAVGLGSVASADPVRPTGPVVLASVTESRTWRTENNATGVGVGVAPDGRVLLAVGEEGGVARIWDPGTGELLRTLTGHQSAVDTLDWGYGRNGRLMLATGSDDGPARIWDPETGELIHNFSGSAENSSLSFNVVAWGYSGGARPLLAAGATTSTWAGATRIWDAETGDLVHSIAGSSDGGIFTIAWGTGRHAEVLLATAGHDGAIQIHNADTGQLLHTLDNHARPVRAVAWLRSADDFLMLVSVGMAARGGDAETVIRTWREGPDGVFTEDSVELAQGQLRTVSCVPVPDGRTLVVGSSDGSLFVLDGSTLAVLHAQAVDFSTRGIHNLDWTVAPDGSLVVCAASNPDRVHVWNITLDPPIPPPVPYRQDRTAAPGRAPATTGKRGRLLLPPHDVTPRFRADEPPTDTYSVYCAVRPDGEPIVATHQSDRQVRIWAVSTGALLHTLDVESDLGKEFAWGHMPDGRLLLATAGTDGSPEIRIWDSDTWQLTAVRTHRSASGDRGESEVNSVAWIRDRDGRPLLASGGKLDRTVYIHDFETGAGVRRLTGHGNYVRAITEGRLADGQRRLVTVSSQSPARLWDPETGELLFEFAVSADHPRASQAWAAAWGRDPGGRPAIAIGCYDGSVRIWEPETGEVLRTLTGHGGPVKAVKWLDQPGWPPVLVSSGTDGTVRIWDPGTGTELARLPCGSVYTRAIDIAAVPNGDLLLVSAAQPRAGDPGPVRIWHIATGSESAEDAGPGSQSSLRAYQASWLTERLLRLGGGGLWPSIGLLADLVTLTGPASTATSEANGETRVDGQLPDRAVPPDAPLYDIRLAALDGEPGVGRLRNLAAGRPRWNPAARVAFAALLASALGIPEQYTPPADADPAMLHRSLAGILGARPGVSAETSTPVPVGTRRAWQAPVGDLRRAAAEITEQTVTLLRILGPDACAADPLLPLRLARHIPQLPVLSQQELRLLDGASGRRPAGRRAAALGTLVYSPGTAGIARSGPLTRLLPAQLALPRDLMTVRLAEKQLLYRQHRAPTPPAPEPVTIVLDTTPPTFGPAGQSLRLAAHLITTTLWEHDRYPALITLTSPGAATDLRASADLVSVWTSSTLDAPDPALAIALKVAAVAGRPVVFCTHHHTVPADYIPGLSTRLLTTHQPPEQAPRPPASPWHAHLPPRPTRQELTTAIARLLVPSAADEA